MQDAQQVIIQSSSAEGSQEEMCDILEADVVARVIDVCKEAWFKNMMWVLRSENAFKQIDLYNKYSQATLNKFVKEAKECEPKAALHANRNLDLLNNITRFPRGPQLVTLPCTCRGTQSPLGSAATSQSYAEGTSQLTAKLQVTQPCKHQSPMDGKKMRMTYHSRFVADPDHQHYLTPNLVTRCVELVGACLQLFVRRVAGNDDWYG